MSKAQLISILQAATELLGQADPALEPTTNEIAALEGVASSVLSVLSSQSGLPIAQVVANLTPEAPLT